jgi:hypothetical protein
MRVDHGDGKRFVSEIGPKACVVMLDTDRALDVQNIVQRLELQA